MKIKERAMCIFLYFEVMSKMVDLTSLTTILCFLIRFTASDYLIGIFNFFTILLFVL